MNKRVARRKQNSVGLYTIAPPAVQPIYWVIIRAATAVRNHFEPGKTWDFWQRNAFLSQA